MQICIEQSTLRVGKKNIKKLYGIYGVNNLKVVLQPFCVTRYLTYWKMGLSPIVFLLSMEQRGYQLLIFSITFWLATNYFIWVCKNALQVSNYEIGDLYRSSTIF